MQEPQLCEPHELQAMQRAEDTVGIAPGSFLAACVARAVLHRTYAKTSSLFGGGESRFEDNLRFDKSYASCKKRVLRTPLLLTHFKGGAPSSKDWQIDVGKFLDGLGVSNAQKFEARTGL